MQAVHTPCHAQHFRNLNADFPMGSSEEIFQDRDGFLWIGTVNGLLRFDGYSTIDFTHDPNDSTSIGGNNLNAIGQDAKGRIWVGLSTYGLNILDKELKHFEKICLPDSTCACMQQLSVNDFALDENGSMWVGTTNGLMQISTGPEPIVWEWHAYNPGDSTSLSNNYVLYTFIDDKRRLWVGTADGVNLFDRSTGSFINHRTNPGFPDNQILDITQDGAGTIWVSCRFGEPRLFVYDEQEKSFRPRPAFGSTMGELRMTFDKEDRLWLSSRGAGAYVMDPATGEGRFFDPHSALLHNFRNFYSLHTICDSYGNVWMTGHLLMQWPATGKKISGFHAQDGTVNSIYADADAIWYSDLELHRVIRSTGRVEDFWPEHLPSEIRADSEIPRSRRVLSIRELDDQRLVFTTTRSIFIWDKRDDAYLEIPTRYGGPLRDCVIDPDGRRVWICGNQGAPIVLDLRTREHHYSEALENIVNPRCVDIAKNGDIWFGTTTHGVFRVDAVTGEITQFSADAPDPSHRLSDYFVNDILCTDDATWAATNLGLNRIDPQSGQVTTIRRQKGFANESVMSVVADDHDVLWLATQQGVVRYEPGRASFAHYDRADGMINAMYTQNSAYKDEKGYLYFGGDRGVDLFHPDDMHSNTVPPDLYISRVLVNSLPADTALAPHHLTDLRLRHNQNFIEIELLALHLTTPAKNVYAYRIPETDTSWRALGTQRTITLANMPPGTYTIEARAANADDVWCAPKKMLSMTIMPPFWATWWFIGAWILLGAGALVLIYRYRMQQVRKEERLKSEFNKKIAELESRALRAQMNPHFLFNSINSVKSLISQGHNDKATQYLTRFGQLIRQVLSNSEKPFVRLQEELEALRLYLEIEQLRFQNFNYEMSVEENVNADFIEVPPLILQPYVENAIWHGLMHKSSGDRFLAVRVSRNGEYLRMVVQDNGIGRHKAQQMKMLGNARKGGMGMRLTGDRLNLLHRMYGQRVTVQVEDLFDNNTPSGTRVEIRIPYTE